MKFLTSARDRYNTLSPFGKSTVKYGAVFIAGLILGLIL
jgi:hypothetical protein